MANYLKVSNIMNVVVSNLAPVNCENWIFPVIMVIRRKTTLRLYRSASVLLIDKS